MDNVLWKMLNRRYMEAFDFSTKWEPQGGIGNLFFYNTKLNRKIPQMLKSKDHVS
jgi:hypothetical protein